MLAIMSCLPAGYLLYCEVSIMNDSQSVATMNLNSKDKIRNI